MARTGEISIEVPDDASEESVRLAKCQAKEAAIVAFQQQGELTIREAALDLGLTYEQYLDLLAAKGLPASNAASDPEVLEAIRQRLHTQRAQPS